MWRLAAPPPTVPAVSSIPPSPSNGLDKPGTVVLDFNYAHNPPCGYTPYATYPLPTEANRIPVAIPAGEKRYDN